MITLELDRVETDHCLGCGGIWLDRGEWELLAGAPGIRETLSRVTSSEERTRRCPICDRKMDKVACGAAGGATVDACRAGDGIWFDRGELARSLGASAGGPVADLLRQTYQQAFNQEAEKR